MIDFRKEAEKLLGKPDDIWTKEKDPRFTQWPEVWCYGSIGHRTMPTLGQLILSKDHGMILGASDSEREMAPPKESVISEKELENSMRQLFRETFTNNSNYDSLKLIQGANCLMRLGKEKAVAVLREYDRVYGFPEQYWLYQLTRVLFVPKDGSFLPPIHLDMHGVPSIMSNSPTYPILMDNDCPFCVTRFGPQMGATFYNFKQYVDESEMNWQIRTKRLIPPADPFLCFDRLIIAKSWPGNSPHENYVPNYSWNLLKEILKLVRTAYEAPQFHFFYSNIEDQKTYLERHHQEFLRLKCHWDEKLQMYVRGDGSFTLDKFDD